MRRAVNRSARTPPNSTRPANGATRNAIAYPATASPYPALTRPAATATGSIAQESSPALRPAERPRGAERGIPTRSPGPAPHGCSLTDVATVTRHQTFPTCPDAPSARPAGVPPFGRAGRPGARWTGGDGDPLAHRAPHRRRRDRAGPRPGRGRRARGRRRAPVRAAAAQPARRDGRRRAPAHVARGRARGVRPGGQAGG